MNPEKNLSTKFLNYLIGCFWINILFISISILSMFLFPKEILQLSKNINNGSSSLVLIILIILDIPFISLIFYAFYFYFKYDKFSKSGIYLFLFNGVYAHIYFYKVIWKRKRNLVNRYLKEPVIGNSVQIEFEEETE